MEREHQDIIISNLSVLVNETDLPRLVPELIKRNVFNQRMIDRILNPSHDSKRQKIDLYVEILKRGPEAFSNLQDALFSTNHSNLANVLRGMDTRDSAQFRRRYSLSSVGSNRSPYSSDNTSESDGPCLSRRKTSSGSVRDAAKRPDSFPQLLPGQAIPRPPAPSDSDEFQSRIDFRNRKLHDPTHKVCNLPSYDIIAIEEKLKAIGVFSPEEKIGYTFETDLPVRVKYSRDWKFNPPGRPKLYKMDSNPRGCALVINNKVFQDKAEYPDRTSAENDEKRFTALLRQLHFTVEVHENKTRAEMVEIVEKFSQKPELVDVDCLWVTFMSHGGEGDTCEEGEIVGVDGFGYKTSDIVSQFYNDSCKAAIDKPKIFFFQACRGSLTDPGVVIPGGNYILPLDQRTVYDGRRMNYEPRNIRVRTHSDVFIAYPSPEGIRANRDIFTGTWFIQTVVNIFSEYSKDCHLEDLLKMVDEKIKGMNNLHTTNFQAVATTSIGWNKHLYFNPGLYRDRNTGATVFFENPLDSPQSDEGMDVVDASSTSSDKSPNGIPSTYSRLKDEKDEESGDDHGKYGCFHFPFCRTS